jgi:hypothetical protein
MVDTSLIFNVIARDQASPVFEKLSGVAAAAGVAIGAALVMGLQGAMEKSKTDALLAAQLGGGPEMAAMFGKMSGHLYAAGFGETAADVNNALKTVWENGLVDEDAAAADIEKVTGLVMTAAGLMEEDTARVSAAVSQMMRTGMAGSAEEALDIIVRSTQQGINKSEDLLDTLNEYSTVFRVIGLDGKTSMGLISQALRAGARDSDTVADALKEFGIRAQDMSKTSQDAYKALGMNAQKSSDAVAKGGAGSAAVLDQVLTKLKAMPPSAERTALAVALFGTKAEDLGDALYAMDLGEAAAALGTVEGAAQKASDTIGKSAGAQLESFKRKAHEALISTMAKAIPYIEKVVSFLTKHQEIMVPLLSALAAFATIIGIIVVITKIAAAVQMAWNIAMALNPIGLIIIAIIALVAGIMILYAKVDWFREGINTFFGWIITAAKLWWSVFSAFWSTVGGWLIAAFQMWWTVFSTVWSTIINGVVSYVGWVIGRWEALIGFIRSLPGRVSAAASGMWDGLKSAFRSAINWIIYKWNSLSFRIPGISVPGLGQIWGGATLSTPDLPYLAKGGNIMAAGSVVVGDDGPEVLTLPKGAQVTPLNKANSGPQAVRIELVGERAMVEMFRRLMRTADLLQGR